MKKIRFFSLWLCLAIIIVFMLQVWVPGFTESGILNESALKGQYWRFLSAVFLHGSLPHLLYNLFALFFFGLSLEKLIGSRKFLFVYFSSGIIANIISVNFYPSSLGASGAIMGLIGALTIIKPFMMVWAFGLILPVFVAAILWVAGDILGIFMPGNVGNIAHLSGIAAGIILGLFLRNWKQNKKELIRVPEGYMRLWEKNYIK